MKNMSWMGSQKTEVEILTIELRCTLPMLHLFLFSSDVMKKSNPIKPSLPTAGGTQLWSVQTHIL